LSVDDADDWQDLHEQALDDAREIQDSIERLAARDDLKLAPKARKLQEVLENE
jgi:hypothetical protein